MFCVLSLGKGSGVELSPYKQSHLFDPHVYVHLHIIIFAFFHVFSFFFLLFVFFSSSSLSFMHSVRSEKESSQDEVNWMEPSCSKMSNGFYHVSFTLEAGTMISFSFAYGLITFSVLFDSDGFIIHWCSIAHWLLDFFHIFHADLLFSNFFWCGLLG